MLLIGSQAARHHYPDFRQPTDIDLIVTPDEAKTLAKQLTRLRKSKSGHHYLGRLGDISVEFELPIKGNETSAMLRGTDQITVHPELPPVQVVSKAALMAIKYSHLTTPLKRWEKHVLDYHFFKDKGLALETRWIAFAEQRRQEIVQRQGRGEPNFEMSNDQFFKQSAKVGRMFPHDEVHRAIDPNPAFQLIKDNLGMAEPSEAKFRDLPLPTRIRVIQEEGWVLALERKLIPGFLEWEAICGYQRANAVTTETQTYYHESYKWAIMRLGTTLSPLWMRQFIAENYPTIIKSTHVVDTFLDSPLWSNHRANRV